MFESLRKKHRALFEKRWDDVSGLIEQNPGISR